MQRASRQSGRSFAASAAGPPQQGQRQGDKDAVPTMAADTRAGSVAAGAAAAAVGTGARSGRSSLKAEALETGKLLAAGGIAGAVSKSATAPLARLTILYQASSSAPSL